MTQQIHDARDVVAFLKAQHEQVKSLLERVQTTSGGERRDAFIELRRLLAVHETAEEEIVHPRVRHELTDGDPIATARLNEEHAAKAMLAELEKMDVDSDEFEAAFDIFRERVLEHAEAEEREEFSRLADALEQDQLTRMRRAVELAEKVAPTRPHAGVDLAMENLMAGPFAAMLDRTRDLLTGKR